jgi:hypothetical protein
MTRVEFVIIAIRLMSLAMFAKALVTLIAVFGKVLAEFGQGRLFHNLITSPTIIVEGAAWAIAAVYFLRRGEVIAWQMFPDDDEATSTADLGFSAEDFLSLGCAVIGVMTIVQSLQWVISDIVTFAVQEDSLDQYWQDLAWRSSFITTLLELAFGGWLLLGSRGFASVIARARSLERRKPSSDGADSSTDSATGLEVDEDQVVILRDEEAAP